MIFEATIFEGPVNAKLCQSKQQGEMAANRHKIELTKMLSTLLQYPRLSHSNSTFFVWGDNDDKGPDV